VPDGSPGRWFGFDDTLASTRSGGCDLRPHASRSDELQRARRLGQRQLAIRGPTAPCESEAEALRARTRAGTTEQRTARSSAPRCAPGSSCGRPRALPTLRSPGSRAVLGPSNPPIPEFGQRGACRLLVVRAAFLWGIDLGTGFTTQSTHPSVWLLPIAVLVTAEPMLGIGMYLLFNFVRGFPVLLGPLLPGDRISWLATLGRPVRKLEVLAAMISVASIVIGRIA
jgi:hypothetical protein